MMQRFATILLLSLSIQYSATLAESSNLRAGAGSHANYADPSHEMSGRGLSASDWWGSLVNKIGGKRGRHSKGKKDKGSTSGSTGGSTGGSTQGGSTQGGSTQDGSTQDGTTSGTTSGMSYYEDGSVSYGGGGGGGSDGATAESSNTETISYEQYAYVKDGDSSNSNNADGSGNSKNGAFIIGALVASVVGAALVATMNKNRDDEDQENSRPTLERTLTSLKERAEPINQGIERSLSSLKERTGPLKERMEPINQSVVRTVSSLKERAEPLNARMGEFVAGVLPMKKKSAGILNDDVGVQASPSFVELARVPSGRFSQSESLSVDDDDDEEEGGYEAPTVVHQQPGEEGGYKAMP